MTVRHRRPAGRANFAVGDYQSMGEPPRDWWLRHPSADAARDVDGAFFERPRALIVVRSTLQVGQCVGVDPRPTRRYTRKKGGQPADLTEVMNRLKAAAERAARQADRQAAYEAKQQGYRKASRAGGGARECNRRMSRWYRASYAAWSRP